MLAYSRAVWYTWESNSGFGSKSVVGSDILESRIIINPKNCFLLATSIYL